MRIRPFVLFLAAACTPESIELRPERAGDPTGNDTGAADTASDTGSSNIGGDTSDTSSTDTSSTDTGTAEESVRYTGNVEGTVSYTEGDADGEFGCKGKFDLTFATDGSVSGTATCGDGDSEFGGDVLGDATKDKFTAVWTLDMGRTSLDTDVKGTADGAKLDADVRGRDDRYQFEGTFSGKVK